MFSLSKNKNLEFGKMNKYNQSLTHELEKKMIITNQVLSDKRMWDIIIFGNGAFDPFSFQYYHFHTLQAT